MINLEFPKNKTIKIDEFGLEFEVRPYIKYEDMVVLNNVVTESDTYVDIITIIDTLILSSMTTLFEDGEDITPRDIDVLRAVGVMDKIYDIIGSRNYETLYNCANKLTTQQEMRFIKESINKFAGDIKNADFDFSKTIEQLKGLNLDALK